MVSFREGVQAPIEDEPNYYRHRSMVEPYPYCCGCRMDRLNRLEASTSIVGAKSEPNAKSGPVANSDAGRSEYTKSAVQRRSPRDYGDRAKANSRWRRRRVSPRSRKPNSVGAGAGGDHRGGSANCRIGCWPRPWPVWQHLWADRNFKRPVRSSG